MDRTVRLSSNPYRPATFLPARAQSPEVFVKDAWIPEPLRKHYEQGGNSHLTRAVFDVLKFIPKEGFSKDAVDAVHALLGRLSATLVIESNLHLTAYRGLHSLTNYNDRRPVEVYGWVGWKVITTAGVGFLVDAWQNSVELEVLKYHSLGTGSTAEASADVALVTELTTEYTGNVRATGSLTEGASANIFRTLGTNTLDGTPGASLREHGVHSADAAGTLWDRTVYGAITLSSGDSLASTYDMTASAGG